MPSYNLSSLMLAITFMALSASLLLPYLLIDPWDAFVRWLIRLKKDRLARKSALIGHRMKKYWVIDMRKLR